jgi:hypothetical protein
MIKFLMVSAKYRMGINPHAQSLSLLKQTSARSRKFPDYPESAQEIRFEITALAVLSGMETSALLY